MFLMEFFIAMAILAQFQRPLGYLPRLMGALSHWEFHVMDSLLNVTTLFSEMLLKFFQSNHPQLTQLGNPDI
jgi:hypothetical protein